MNLFVHLRQGCLFVIRDASPKMWMLTVHNLNTSEVLHYVSTKFYTYWKAGKLRFPEWFPITGWNFSILWVKKTVHIG